MSIPKDERNAADGTLRTGSKLLSIVICTYNRIDSLKLVLKELLEQFHNFKQVSSSAEIIIIDNNSNDATTEELAKFKSEHPELDFKCFVEQEQGSSAARNRGIKEALGNLIVFLDDDIHLGSHWLMELHDLAQTKPVNFVAGARVVPLWAQNLPTWLNLEPPFEIIQSCFPAHDYGTQEQIYPFSYGMRKVQNPISACFLATKDVFEKYGVFRLDLGIHGKERGACEDTELFWRLTANGVQIKYMPQICIKHPIPPERMQKKFVLAWYELLGKTLQYMLVNKLVHNQPNAKAPSKLKLTVKFFVLYFLYFIFALSLNPALIFWFECQLAKTKGQLRHKV